MLLKPLQTLPRINLTGGLTSNYQIRKTCMEDGPSAIESIVEAMQTFEPAEHFNKMLQPFEYMVKLQQSNHSFEVKNSNTN